MKPLLNCKCFQVGGNADCGLCAAEAGARVEAEVAAAREEAEEEGSTAPCPLESCVDLVAFAGTWMPQQSFSSSCFPGALRRRIQGPLCLVCRGHCDFSDHPKPPKNGREWVFFSETNW